MSPLIQSQRSLLAPAWAGYPNELWRRAKARPSLDLRFADNKSLVDATTGQNLVTFTRASSGTYVDSQGVIRTATTNLLLRSEEFNDSVWGKVGGSVTADAITAPNGQTTADLFTENTVLTQHDVRVTSPTLTDGVTYTLTVYSKTNGRRLNIIYPLDTAGHGATFDLVNGTFTYTGNTVTATIQPVGDGWYRCSCTATKSGGSGTAQLRFLTHNGTTNNYTGDGTSGIYLWGAQLEQSNTVGEYIPTTSTINSAPRFDHNPTTGESLGLLVEESRTNLILESEEFEDTYWSKSNAFGTVTANQATSPDGASAADLYQESTANSSRYLARSLSFTSGTSYTLSIWAKQAPGATRYLGLILPAGAFGVNVGCAYTLSDSGTATITVSGTNTTASIQAFPGGWYRCVLSSQATITTPVGVQIRLSNSPAAAATTYTGDGFSGLYIWGAQLEAGSFPTSYIPTTTATVTRSADVASITGTNFSSWYRQDEGTVFATINRDTGIVSNVRAVSATDGTLNNRVFDFRQDTSSLGYAFSVTNGSTDLLQSVSLTTGSRSNAIAIAQSLNNAAVVANGSIAGTDTSVLMPVVNQLNIGSLSGINQFNGTVRRLTYWPQRLPNSTLQQITQ